MQSMPERGWSILTVREDTAKMVKELAHTKDLTVDELLNELMSPSGKAGWSTCHLCGAKVKSKNIHEHMAKVHPKPENRLNQLTSQPFPKNAPIL